MLLSGLHRHRSDKDGNDLLWDVSLWETVSAQRRWPSELKQSRWDWWTASAVQEFDIFIHAPHFQAQSKQSRTFIQILRIGGRVKMIWACSAHWTKVCLIQNPQRWCNRCQPTSSIKYLLHIITPEAPHPLRRLHLNRLLRVAPLQAVRRAVVMWALRRESGWSASSPVEDDVRLEERAGPFTLTSAQSQQLWPRVHADTRI